MANTRTEKITSTQDIYEGMNWRNITDDEFKLILRLEVSVMNGMSQFEREFATRDMVNGKLIEKLVSRYPEEKAEEGFYQTITFNGQTSFAIHPLAMGLFDQIACDLYRAARTLKPRDIDNYYRAMIDKLKAHIN